MTEVDAAKDPGGNFGLREPVTKAIRLNPLDQVGVATRDVDVGALVDAGGDLVRARQRIPMGHKIALSDIALGEPVRKYGEVIGYSTSMIDQGSHVHVHNVVSARLPGPSTTGGDGTTE